MAKSDCVTCGRTLYYSHPSLEAKGLFSPAWGAYLERRYGKVGMRCLRCSGTEACVSCGQKLGDIGSVAEDKDNERDCFCGTEFCVDCVKSELPISSLKSKSRKKKSRNINGIVLGVFLILSVATFNLLGDDPISGFMFAMMLTGLMVSLIIFLRSE